MEIMYFVERYAGESIGIFALVGLFLFVQTYRTHANWRANEQGRSVMYLAVGLLSTICLLVLHGMLGGYPLRWVVEVIIFTPLALACWYLRYTLRVALGLPARWPFKIPEWVKRHALRKKTPSTPTSNGETHG